MITSFHKLANNTLYLTYREGEGVDWWLGDGGWGWRAR